MNSSNRDFLKKTHRFFFYSFSDALNDVLDNGDMITVGFIASKPHHPPSRQRRIPMDFNDAIINLFSRSLEPIPKESTPKKVGKEKEKELVFSCRKSAN